MTKSTAAVGPMQVEWSERSVIPPANGGCDPSSAVEGLLEGHDVTGHHVRGDGLGNRDGFHS